MKVVMAFLAEQWVLGYSVITILCITGYLVYSIKLLKFCRSVEYDIGVSAMVPFWNIIVLLKGIHKGKKLNTIDEDEIFEL